MDKEVKGNAQGIARAEKASVCPAAGKLSIVAKALVHGRSQGRGWEVNAGLRMRALPGILKGLNFIFWALRIS